MGLPMNMKTERTVSDEPRRNRSIDPITQGSVTDSAGCARGKEPSQHGHGQVDGEVTRSFMFYAVVERVAIFPFPLGAADV